VFSHGAAVTAYVSRGDRGTLWVDILARVARRNGSSIDRRHLGELARARFRGMDTDLRYHHYRLQ